MKSSIIGITEANGNIQLNRIGVSDNGRATYMQMSIDEFENFISGKFTKFPKLTYLVEGIILFSSFYFFRDIILSGIVIIIIAILNKYIPIVPRDEEKLVFKFMLDEDLTCRYDNFKSILNNELKSDVLWQVINRPTKIAYEKTGQIGHLVFKRAITITNASDLIESNIELIKIGDRNKQLVFLPNGILHIKHKSAKFYRYEDIHMKTSKQNIVEDARMSYDSKKIGETMMTNSVAKGNRIVPVFEYGQLELIAYEKFEYLLMTSKSDAEVTIARAISILGVKKSDKS